MVEHVAPDIIASIGVIRSYDHAIVRDPKTDHGRYLPPKSWIKWKSMRVAIKGHKTSKGVPTPMDCDRPGSRGDTRT